MTERKKPTLPGLPVREAWIPPAWEVEDAGALQALAAGKAAPHQQVRALDYIIKSLAATYDMAYRPESARDTDFALGRQFVGQQVVYLLKLNLAQFKTEKR
jgi:hypothetical protein